MREEDEEAKRKKRNPNDYVFLSIYRKDHIKSRVFDSPFIDALALVEMPRKFSFPKMKLYDDTTNPTDYIKLYKQRMFYVAIPRNLQEACAQPNKTSLAMVHQPTQ